MNERGEEIDSATLFRNILDNSSGPDEPFGLRELSVLKLFQWKNQHATMIYHAQHEACSMECSKYSSKILIERFSLD